MGANPVVDLIANVLSKFHGWQNIALTIVVVLTLVVAGFGFPWAYDVPGKKKREPEGAETIPIRPPEPFGFDHDPMQDVVLVEDLQSASGE